jgi:rhamnogalacturonyl hydrolase YesR
MRRRLTSLISSEHDFLNQGKFMKKQICVLTAAALAIAGTHFGACQNPPANDAPAAVGAVQQAAAGNQPDNPGPLATHLSPALNRKDILRAVKKVADWQLKDAEGRYNTQWTFAALYDGMLAASRVTGDRRYHDRVLEVAQQNHWGFGPRFGNADDEAIGFTYLTLYAESHAPEMLAPTKEGMDKLLARPDDPQKNLWWWCDALYMAPPVLAQLSAATGDRRYLDFMDHEWSLTTKALYDPSEHLFFRDDRYLTMHEANGKKVYWSRGDGWVLAGLALVLERMPAEYPSRPKYEAQFREIAERVAELQPADGLWRSSLLDPDSYPAPEVSGTGFYTFAMAWGIRHHLLDREKFLPVVKKGWQGMLTHVYADGRLGSIQPIGAEPGKYKPSSSFVYGTGAFLMAGSELYLMSR